MKKTLILIIIVCIATGLFFFLKKKDGINSLNSPQQVNTVSEIGAKNVQSEETKNSAELKNNTNTLLQAGSIKLISPFNGQTIISGSNITVQYELLAPVKFGTIIIGPDCTHLINDQEKVGKYSFECTIPQLVGSFKIGIQELIYSPTVEAKNADGQLTLVSANNISVKDFEYYPESPILIQASPQVQDDGYIAFRVLYSDGTKKEVDATNFTFTFADPTMVSIFGAPREGTVYLDGKKVGKTQVVVKYAGIQKVIPIEVIPYDDTME
jgi:hypothetical protein